MQTEIKNIYDFIEDNKITKIFLDVDGVVFASCQAVADLVNDFNNTNYSGQEVMSWDFKEINSNPKIDTEHLFSTKEFFRVVQPINGVLEFLDKYRDKIVIVTKGTEDNFMLKRKWFNKKGFKDIPIIAIPLTMSKNIIDMFGYEENVTMFIDDSTNNLNECNSADFNVQFREYNDELNEQREWIKNWNGLYFYNF